ncbi:MAG TPA: AI-2E family transporter [Methyloceanibacter sp.]|nr:AI-2E family transporter [Methyloceanibacter sp.]
MPPRFPLLTTLSDARTAALQGLLIAAIVIAALSIGRDVLLPLALAILLSFALTPPLVLLRWLKVPRVIAVSLVVGAAFTAIVALGWLISREATQLAADLPTYRQALSEKIKSLRETTASSPVLKRAGDVLSDLQEELATKDEPPPAPEVGTRAEHPDDKPLPVEIRERAPTPLEFYRRVAGTVLPPLATAGIVLLFVVFILLQREDLRDRAIRLFGASDLQRATAALTDAASRLSRYFLRQVLINTAYGAIVALGLWLIGVPSAIVWGVLAGLMRFVPFIGSYIAAIPPLLLAAVIDPGWNTFLLVLAFYVAGELAMGQVVEPLVFGRGIGVTPLAVVISTVFWTWLWGPLGLILAMPITVCLAVLGRHVEGLRFFEILLGDRPALTPAQSFYRRALAGDAAEATYQAELHLRDQSLQAYLGEVALPGLKLAEEDARRGLLDAKQAKTVAATVEEMLDNLADFEPRRWFAKLRSKPEPEEEGGLASLAAAENGEEEALPIVERDELALGWAVEEPILSIGGRTALDQAAAAMLAEVLRKRGLGTKALPPEAISAGHIASLSGTEAKLVCLSYLGLGTGPAHIRYLVRRLRRILPEGTLILVCYFAEAADTASAKALLEEAGADASATTLDEAADLCIAAAKGGLKEQGEGTEIVVAAPAGVAPPPVLAREPRARSSARA